MQLELSTLSGTPAAAAPVEMVERKGLGHPDTLCDAFAERLCRALSRFYLERADRILHHNVDKVLLFGGAARPAFGGGEVLAPAELYLAGRATAEAGGARVPVADLARETARAAVRETLHAFDPDAHLAVHCLVRPGASELVAVHGRARANDTSCGAGYAPLSALERAVLAVERALTSSAVHASHPAFGEDVKVMGVRRGERLELTVACAIIGRHCRNLGEYLAAKHEVERIAREAAAAHSPLPSEVGVNVGDDPERGNVYLTVTGTSAEAGDDGQAGRGNRANGLITPYRPMTLESVAGKNPVTHVGKIYNEAAHRIAAALVAELTGVHEAECRLVARIGAPVAEPLADVRLRLAPGQALAGLRRPAGEILERELADLDARARAWALAP